MSGSECKFGAIALVWAASVMCLFSSVQAEIRGITIQPPDPAPGMLISLHVDGELSDQCWEITGYNLSQAGQIIIVDVYANDTWQPGGSCALAVVPYSIDYDLDPLPAGTYAIRVIEHDNSLRFPATLERHLCFAVGGAGYACECSCYADQGCDGVVDVTDVIRAIGLSFRGYQPAGVAQCPWQEMDVNCTGATDVLDVLEVIEVAFRGAPPTSFCTPCVP